MSVGLFLIANIKIPLNNFQKVATKLADKLNTMSWHNAEYEFTYDEKEKPVSTLRDKRKDIWKITPYYNDGNAASINIESCNYEISSIEIFQNVCVMSVLDRYRDIYSKNKCFDDFQYFRKKVYEILTFLNGSEIIYLPDSSYRLAKYLDLPKNYKSYDVIKELMMKEIPKMQTNYFDLSYTNEIKNEFILDDFNDLKTGKPYPKKSKTLILGYLDTFQDLDNRIEKLAYYLKTNIAYKKYSPHKIPKRTITKHLITNETFTENAILKSKVTHFYENSFKWSDFILKNEKGTPIYQTFLNCYRSNITFHNFPELIQKLKEKDTVYLTNFNKKRRQLKTELAIFNCDYALYIFEQELSNTVIHCYISDTKYVAKERYRTTIQLNLSSYLLGKTEFNKEHEVLVIYDDFEDLDETIK